MAGGKNTIVIYRDWKAIFNKLTDDEAGRLIKHLFAYINDENPVSDRLTELLFEPIKLTLKRDLKHWESVLEKRSLAGKASAEKRQQMLTHVDFVKQSSTKSTDSDSDSVSDSVSDSEINNKEDSIEGKPSQPESKIDFEMLKKYFNETCKLMPTVVKMTEARKMLVRSRLNQYDKATLKLVIKKASESDFLNGKTTKVFFASFDWIFNATNFTKVLEGNYDNNRSNGLKMPLKRKLSGNIESELGISPDYEKYKENLKLLSEKKKVIN